MELVELFFPNMGLRFDCLRFMLVLPLYDQHLLEMTSDGERLIGIVEKLEDHTKITYPYTIHGKNYT